MLPTFITNPSLYPTFLWSVWTYYLHLPFQTVFVISDDVRKQTINLLHAIMLQCDIQWDMSLIFQQLKTDENYVLCVINSFFLTIKPTRCTNFSNLFLQWNCTCFGEFLCPSSELFHCTHSDGICHTGLLYDICHCCVYSEKLPIMDRETVRNM
jgi:hypothetical protein